MSVGLCLMLKTRKLAQPCIWPVPMLESDLEMLESTYRKCACVDSNICTNLECTQIFSLIRHGMSYPISGLVKTFTAEDYDSKKPLIVSEKLQLNYSLLRHIIFQSSWLPAASWPLSGHHCSSYLHIHCSTLPREAP